MQVLEKKTHIIQRAGLAGPFYQEEDIIWALLGYASCCHYEVHSFYFFNLHHIFQTRQNNVLLYLMISPEELLTGYANGIFPMADTRNDPQAKWYTARRRGIIPLDKFHVSSNVQRIVRNHHYSIKFDTDFRQVMKACSDRKTTWISEEILDSYCRLYDLGYAHSISVYNKQQELVGGQYGVSLKSAYFGESMFGSAKEASKVALYWTHQALLQGKFELWDTQFWTEHLAQFGAIEISAEAYRQQLQNALKEKATFRKVDIYN